MSPPLTGGCLCGAIRFELTEPPKLATYCHCTRCQRRTGTAASAQAIIVPGSLRWLADEPATIRMGAFDTDPGVRPSLRQWVSSAAPWEPIPDDGLQRFDGSAQG
ncbi:MAG: GFA family protein [Solirubrobacteraceae bacterium]|nr:GFA family protein [Gemmatimonadaceae bacterium]